MLKLKFKESDHLVKGTNEYEEIGGLPVNIVLDRPISIGHTFDTYYVTGNDFFIELRFDTETKIFNQIAFVCIGETSESSDNALFKIDNEKLFECYLDSIDTEVSEMVCDISVVKLKKSLAFKINEYCESETYCIAENLVFRVDQDNCLCEIIVIDQKELLESFDYLATA